MGSLRLSWCFDGVVVCVWGLWGLWRCESLGWFVTEGWLDCGLWF